MRFSCDSAKKEEMNRLNGAIHLLLVIDFFDVRAIKAKRRFSLRDRLSKSNLHYAPSALHP